MKDCLRFAPMIGAREDELSAEESAALEAHLADCPSCRATAADFAAVDGLVSEALLAQANARDFGPFVDQVMARVRGPGRADARRGVWGWLSLHRRAVAATLAPVLAALAVLVYVRVEHGRRPEIALLELSSEGEATTVLQTQDGPVVLLSDESGS
jgi:anti-sigma factor RsiW